MAQARRTRAQTRGAGLPGWGMLLIGLVIGLFIAFLVYLDKLDPNTTANAPPPPQPAKEKPQFEFYSILPELEVVIPDAFKKPAELNGNNGASGNTTQPKEIYFLQAGSFKSAAEADRMKASLALLGLDVVVQSVAVNNVTWHRVRVGPLTNSRTLDVARQRLLENQIDFMLLKVSG